jgi:predicted nucleic acid-binding protein
MAVTTWLIDKSALVRLGSSTEAAQWADRIGRGLVFITTVTLLEVGYSARSGRDLRQASTIPPLSLMPVEYLTPAMEQRAVEVQMQLADRGEHRAYPTCSSRPPPNGPATRCCTSTRTSS